MPEVRLSVDGIEKHLAQLEALKNAGIGAMVEAALSGGDVIAQNANQNLGAGEKVVAQLNLAETTPRRVWVEIGLLAEFWYYRFREYGTTAHEIRPETALALRSFDGGGAEFSVGHEVGGVAADPFLRPAYDTQKGAAVREMARVYERRFAEAVR